MTEAELIQKVAEAVALYKRGRHALAKWRELTDLEMIVFREMDNAALPDVVAVGEDSADP